MPGRAGAVHRAGRGPDRRRRRGAPDRRPGPHDAGVHEHRRAAGPAAGPAGGAAAHLLGGQRGGHPPLLHRAGAAGVGAGGGAGEPAVADARAQTQSPGQPGAGAPAHRWRLQVVHRTAFHYSGPVRSSYNEARLTPENSNRQTTLRSRVEIEPAGDRLRLPRLLGLHGHRVRPAQPARGAGRHRRRRSSRPARTSPRTTGWAGRAWPAARCRDQFGELLRPDAADRDGRRRGRARPATPSATRGAARGRARWSAGSCTTTWSTCPARRT